VSNDSDLERSITLAVQAGADIVNPHPQATSRRFSNAASFEIPFRPEVPAKCQMPNTVADARRKQIHKPRAWRA